MDDPPPPDMPPPLGAEDAPPVLRTEPEEGLLVAVLAVVPVVPARRGVVVGLVDNEAGDCRAPAKAVGPVPALV
jgi:hypothetical protein